MQELESLVVGGVPEHFNLPWRKAIESGVLERDGVAVRFEDYPGGSGAMCAALNDGRLDVAMLLTEGAVAGIAKGGAFRIISRYTETPLLWGIHVPSASGFRVVEDVRGARYAISRIGSGSHLMAFVLAREHGWPLEGLQFEAVGGVDGAIAAFEKGMADVFLWERFMTQPLVDDGTFRRIGEFAAPWPAFVVCATEAALAERPDAISKVLTRVFSIATELTGSAAAADEISARYGLRHGDAAEWLRITRWASSITSADDAAAAALGTLQEVGLIAPQGGLPPGGAAG